MGSLEYLPEAMLCWITEQAFGYLETLAQL